MGRPPKWTDQDRAEFLRQLEAGSTVKAAAAAIGSHPNTFYAMRDRDPEFRDRWQAAIELGTQTMEQEAFRQALDGVEEPIFHRGVQVGSVTKYSDNLLQFLLRGRRPNVYGNQVSVRHQGEIEQTVTLSFRQDEAERIMDTVRGVLGLDRQPSLMEVPALVEAEADEVNDGPPQQESRGMS